jgi:hypothetical protein
MWEKIDGETSRMKVPNGWIVRSIQFYFGAAVSLHQIFIVDPGHQWKLDDKS